MPPSTHKSQDNSTESIVSSLCVGTQATPGCLGKPSAKPSLQATPRFFFFLVVVGFKGLVGSSSQPLCWPQSTVYDSSKCWRGCRKPATLVMTPAPWCSRCRDPCALNTRPDTSVPVHIPERTGTGTELGLTHKCSDSI